MAHLCNLPILQEKYTIAPFNIPMIMKGKKTLMCLLHSTEMAILFILPVIWQMNQL